MNQPVLEFKNVTWPYEDMDHPALRDVSFTVDRGELVGIIGVNDAGKSTLCRLCNGLIPHPFIGQLTGDVLVNGRAYFSGHRPAEPGNGHHRAAGGA